MDQVQLMDSSGRPPAWKVLLIGGHSGTGKTVVSSLLARRFGTGLTQVDDFRLVLERMTTEAEQPAIHQLSQIVWDPEASPQAACEALIKAAEVASYALEIVVAHHVATNNPTIIEGDGIVPSFAAQTHFCGEAALQAVRAVFVIEEDEKELLESASKRGRGFEDLSPDHKQ